MFSITHKISHALILAAFLALPSCAWAEQRSEPAGVTETEELHIGSEASNEADEALVAGSEIEADKGDLRGLFEKLYPALRIAANDSESTIPEQMAAWIIEYAPDILALCLVNAYDNY